MAANYTDKEAVGQSLKYLDQLERSKPPFMRGGPASPFFGIVSGDKVNVRIDNMPGVGKEDLRVFPEEYCCVIEGLEESNNDEDEDEDEEEERVYLKEMVVESAAHVMKDDVFDPFLAACRVMGVGWRRGWDVKQDSDAVYLRMDMPGVSKENVNVSVDQQNSTLIIKGEGEKESSEEDDDDDEYVLPSYSTKLHLPPNFYKIDETKAEMKNGVLKVVVPKVKEEKTKDVFQVKVD